MSIVYVPGSFITIPNKDYLHLLTATEIVVYMWIISYTNKNGTCYPSRTLIASKIKSNKKNDFENCISIDTVDRAIKRLEEFKFIKVVRSRKTKKGKLTSNVYYSMILTSKKDRKEEEETDNDLF